MIVLTEVDELGVARSSATAHGSGITQELLTEMCTEPWKWSRGQGKRDHSTAQGQVQCSSWMSLKNWLRAWSGIRDQVGVDKRSLMPWRERAWTFPSLTSDLALKSSNRKSRIPPSKPLSWEQELWQVRTYEQLLSPPFPSSLPPRLPPLFLSWTQKYSTEKHWEERQLEEGRILKKEVSQDEWFPFWGPSEAFWFPIIRKGTGTI